MRALLLLCLTLAPLIAGAAGAVRELSAADWDRPRSADTVRALPVLVDLMAELDRAPGRRLVVRHPGGEHGLLWAEELRAWLVALGLPSSQVALVPGALPGDTLELRLRGAGEP